MATYTITQNEYEERMTRTFRKNTPPIPPAKQRDSNMELYRILAMVFVMIFHACGEIGLMADAADSTLTAENVVVLWLTAATFTCVDMFVLLSGWYGIRARREKLQRFLFQVLFYSVLIYAAICTLISDVGFRWTVVAHILTTGIYWFVPVYLMLFIASAALNPFIRQSSRRQYLLVLGGMLMMQTVFGWLSKEEKGYLEGCSPISFIILYLLGGYLRRFPDNFLARLKRWQLAALFLLAVSANSLLAVAAKMLHSDYLNELSWRYASPLVIVAATSMLLIFSKTNIGHSKKVNWIAASSFAVFLVHCFPFFYIHLFRPSVRALWSGLPLWLSVPAIVLFLALLFLASIIFDKGRIWIYDHLVANKKN